ncbi:MAG: 4Fe-4S binding protein [Alistipes sp.]|nr:4Fe-4S binding protein [Alistipes sp.]MDE5906214.1 4Fe-4S binding protein [Alistipes sp.]
MKNTEIVLRTDRCTGCGHCVEACRHGVLRLADNGQGRFVQVADADRCAGCRHCERSCRNMAIVIRKLAPNPENTEKQQAMKHNLKFVLHLIGGIAVLAAICGAAMWLWNALVPEIFGWKAVGYWQMLGLLALAHLFFGHMGHLSKWDKHRHLHETMHGLSREERREFIRRRMRSLCNEAKPTDHAGEAE